MLTLSSLKDLVWEKYGIACSVGLMKFYISPEVVVGTDLIDWSWITYD